MKTSTLPMICGVALAAMFSAGLSHWWSVRQFITAVDTGIPVNNSPLPTGNPIPAPVNPRESSNQLLAGAPSKTPAAAASPDQKSFYGALIAKMESLQSQNRDLLDQMAETNRDVMKLEFRVDTHSESFRPLPVSEDRPFISNIDDGPGVLPPRAAPVLLPNYE
jgi:hypothetical protein